MYNFSLFANGVIFAEELPTGVSCQEIQVVSTDLTIQKNVTKTLEVNSSTKHSPLELSIAKYVPLSVFAT